MENPRRSSVKKLKEFYERKSATDKRNSRDEQTFNDFLKITKKFGYNKYLKNVYDTEDSSAPTKIQDRNVNVTEDPNNIKNFCVDIELLFQNYQDQIGNYKKKFEELRTENALEKDNDTKGKGSVGSDNKIDKNYESNLKTETQLEIQNQVTNTSEGSMNTDELGLDDITYFLNKYDINLEIKPKETKEAIKKEDDSLIKELQLKIDNYKKIMELHEEKIQKYESENKKLKELIYNYFSDEDLTRLDKLERKFQSYNNHINNMIDEILLLKKTEMPVFKFFSREEITENNKANKTVKVIKPNKENSQISSNFSNYMKKIAPKKDLSLTGKESNKFMSNLKNQLQCANKIVIDLITEILFLEYKQEYLSINFPSINTYVVDNFNVILNSIFINEKAQSRNNPIDSNFSIYHEYLQDIFFKIYQVYLREKISMNAESRIPIKDYSFMIIEEFLTEEIIENIVEEVSNENSFFLLVNDSERDFLPLDEWFDYKIENLMANNLLNLDRYKTENNIYANNEEEEYNENVSPNTQRNYNLDKFSRFEKVGDQSTIIDFGRFNNNNSNNAKGLSNINFDLNIIKNNKEEIKDNLTKRLDVLYDKFRYDIKLIITKAKNYIRAGKILTRNSILYDFSKYYTDYSSIEIKNNEILYNQMSIAEDTVINFDNLNYNLKYNRNNFKGFYYSLDSRLNGKFVVPKNISLTNTLVYLFNYNLSSLITLSIRDYHFDEESIINLNKIIEFTNNLVNLDISSNALEDKGIRSISETLKLNKSIKTLNLGYNNLTANGAFYLADYLMKNSIIERLLVAGNNLSGIGLDNLMKVLSEHSSIKHLDISNNKLKDSDILSITNFITKNLRFEGLNISYNYLDVNTLNALGLSFKENKTLKFFKGTNLGLTQDSAPYLLQHLSNSKIEEIHLDNNNLGEIGGILISNVIKNNKKLKIVSLKNCNLDSIALTCICHAFEINKNFKNLYLDLNKFDNDAIENLCLAITNKEITVNLSKSTLSNAMIQRIQSLDNIIIN